MSSSAAAAKLRSSCDACLANKTKCSRAKPSCARCTQRGKPCIYSQCRKIGRPSRHDRAASSSCHAQDAPIQPKRLLPPAHANDNTTSNHNHNTILPLPNNASGGGQGDAAAAHRDADSLASFLSKSHAMLDNVLLASASASASASDGDAVDDMADVNIDPVHPDDESTALDNAMQWDSMDQFLSTGLGSCCLAAHSDHDEHEQDYDDADADADLVHMSYAISTPILDTSTSSFRPVSVSPDAIFSTTGSASGHYSLSPDYPPTTITTTTTPENGPLASHPKRHLLYSHQHHHHPLAHLHDPGPASASASASLAPPTPIYHAHAGREAGAKRPRPHAERNSIIATTANMPTSRTACRRYSRSSSTTSTATTSSLPSSRARCRRDCHVKLVRQLDYITESRTHAHADAGAGRAENEARAGLPLDALLAMDGRVRQEHDKILGCDACMSSSRVNQTLMMVTTALSSMLDLFKKDSSGKRRSRSRSRSGVSSSSPSSSSTSSSSSPNSRSRSSSSPLTVGQLLVDDDAKYSCSRQLLRMFLERQIRTISALNELTIHVGQQNNATLKVTRDLLCDITKRVHYFLGLLEMTESSISANTRRRIRST